MNQYHPTAAEDIVKEIEQADQLQLDHIILAVVHRYNTLCNNRIATFLTVPANPQDRAEEMESTIRLIRTCYNRQDSP